MQTQGEINSSKIATDQVIALIVFAACCAISFFSEPTVAEAILTANP